MALATLPTFTASGYSLLTTALLPRAAYTNWWGYQVNTPTLQAVPTAIAIPAGSGPATTVLTNQGPDAAWVLTAAAVESPTATQATVGAKTIVVSSATGILVGQIVTNGGSLAPGTIVTSISGTTIGISQPTLAALSTTNVFFITAVTPATGFMLLPGQELAIAYVSGFLSALCCNPASRSIIGVVVGV